MNMERITRSQFIDILSRAGSVDFIYGGFVSPERFANTPTEKMMNAPSRGRREFVGATSTSIKFRAEDGNFTFVVRLGKGRYVYMTDGKLLVLEFIPADGHGRHNMHNYCIYRTS